MKMNLRFSKNGVRNGWSLVELVFHEIHVVAFFKEGNAIWLDLSVLREMFFDLCLFLSLLTRSCVLCAVAYVEHRKFLLKTFLLNHVSFEVAVLVLAGVTN